MVYQVWIAEFVSCVRLSTETCRWTPLEDLENHIVVTEAETAEGIDPYVQDCISLNVKETVRNGMLNWKMVMELS